MRIVTTFEHFTCCRLKRVEFCCEDMANITITHLYDIAVEEKLLKVAVSYRSNKPQVYINKTEICHCPFCGTKIEFIRED